MKKCEYCNKEHNGFYGSGRFCSKKCAKGFSTKANRSSINKKVSKTLKEKFNFEPPLFDYVCEKCGKNFKQIKIRSGRKIHCDNCKRKVIHYKDINKLDSILQLAKNTVFKILKRANIKCQRCGWNEGTLDIHHINGKKEKDKNRLENLVILCPNCHRLCHNHKISKEELYNLSIDKTFKNWRDYYHPSN